MRLFQMICFILESSIKWTPLSLPPESVFSSVPFGSFTFSSFFFYFFALSIRLMVQCLYFHLFFSLLHITFVFIALKPPDLSLMTSSFRPCFSPLASALFRAPRTFHWMVWCPEGDIISRNTSLLPRLWGRTETDGAETKPTISPRKALIRSLWPITFHCSPS